jgi:hypothetical protein
MLNTWYFDRCNYFNYFLEKNKIVPFYESFNSEISAFYKLSNI